MQLYWFGCFACMDLETEMFLPIAFDEQNLQLPGPELVNEIPRRPKSLAENFWTQLSIGMLEESSFSVELGCDFSKES